VDPVSPHPNKIKKKKVFDNWSLSVITADSEMSNMAFKGKSPLSPQESAEPEAASMLSNSRLKAPPITYQHCTQPCGAKPQEQNYHNNEQL
jgi:hypothetical protein